MQITKSFRYARRTGRTLILDTTQSGLECAFEDLFEASTAFGCEVIGWTPELGRFLDTVESVRPKALTHRTWGYRAEFLTETGECVDADTGAVLGFDFSADHQETLLIYDQLGGGYTGIDALSWMSLVKNVADEVGRRVCGLGSDFDAIHIRNSDYKTDYRNFFSRSAALFAGRSVLVCTDSARVKAEATELLGPRVNVLSIANTPDTGGVPLHARPDGLDRAAANIDLISELIAMGRSKRFAFTTLKHTSNLAHERPRFSGLSVLAEMLRARPEVLPVLFSKADPEVFRSLFISAPTVQSDARLFDAIRRLVAGIDEYRWNRPAKLEARRIWRIAQRAREQER